jgi:hypothetical protein
MIERDYILRMFKLLGQALSRILFFKETMQYDEALTEIDKAAKSILGLNMEMIERIPLGGLRDIVGSDRALLYSKLSSAGSLLREKGEIMELQGDEEGSVNSYLKALSLFMEEQLPFNDLDDGTPARAAEFVIGRLRNYEIPISLRKNLATYYEKRGQYDKLEDVIFEIVDEDGEFIQSGISTYERLLEKSDAELAAGHLPRNEVEDGLAELRGKLGEKGDGA